MLFHRISRGLLVLAGLTFGGCQLPPDYPASIISGITAGSVLELHREITIPADRASIFIQNGEVLPHAAVDQYRLHCKWESRLRSPQAQRIDPDRFIIQQLQVDDDYTWLSPLPKKDMRLVLASDGPSPQNYAIVMHLYSAKQTAILRLVCSHWEDPVDARFPTLEQINLTLEDIARIIRH